MSFKKDNYSKRARSPEPQFVTIDIKKLAELFKSNSSKTDDDDDCTASSSSSAKKPKKEPKFEESSSSSDKPKGRQPKEKPCGYSDSIEHERCKNRVVPSQKNLCPKCLMNLCAKHYHNGVCEHCIENAALFAEDDEKQARKEASNAKKAADAQFKRELAALKAKHGK